VILALDPATRLTGWCLGTGAGLPEVGAWRFEQVGADLGLLGHQLTKELQACWSRSQFGLVVYEAPILLSRKDDLLKLRKLYGLGVVIETWARSRGIDYREVSLQSVKKELTGNARAEKGDMVAAAERVGLKLPIKTHGQEDAADAFAVWLLALRLYGDKKLASDWDRRIWAARGGRLV